MDPAITPLVVSVMLKVMEYILKRTKMSDEQKKVFMDFVSASFKEQQTPATLYQMVRAAESDVQKKKRDYYKENK